MGMVGVDTAKYSVLVALPYSLNDTLGNTLDDIFTSYRLMAFGLDVAVKIGARDALGKMNASYGEVEFVPVDIWDPEWGAADSYYAIDSGGYAVATLYDKLAEYGNVIGIVGDFFSKTTRFTAGLSSHFKVRTLPPTSNPLNQWLLRSKVPFCGATQGSIALSNKNNYPYFWRMIPARGAGKHYVTIFQSFGARKVCILQSEDVMSASMSEEVQTELLRRGMRSVVIRFSNDMLKMVNYRIPFEQIQRNRCKFIFVTMISIDTYNVYTEGIKANLTNTNYLWMAYNNLMPSYEDSNMTSYFGAVISSPFQPLITDKDLQEAQEMRKQYWDLIQIEKDNWGWKDLNFTEVEEAYVDALLMNSEHIYTCVQHLERNRASSFDFLLKDKDSLNHTAFSETGLTNPFFSEVRMNEYGDRETNFMSFLMNQTVFDGLMEEGKLSLSLAFGFTNLEGTRFTQLFQPTFKNQTTQPPVDDDENPPPIQLITSTTLPGILLRCFQAFSLLSLLISAILHISQQKVFKDFIKGFIFLGNSLAIASTFWSFGSIESRHCFVPSLLFVQSVATIFGPVVYVCARRRWLENNMKRLLNQSYVTPMTMFTLLFQTINAVVVLVWLFFENRTGDQTALTHPAEFLSVCGARSYDVEFAFRLFLGLFNLSLIAYGFQLLVRSKPSKTVLSQDNMLKMLSAFYITILIFELTFSSSVIKMTLEGIILNTSAIISSVVMCFTSRDKVGSAKKKEEHRSFFTEQSNVRCLDMGKVKVVFRGNLGWKKEQETRLLIIERHRKHLMSLASLDSRQLQCIDLRPMTPSQIFSDQTKSIEVEYCDGLHSKLSTVIALPSQVMLLQMPSKKEKDEMDRVLTDIAGVNMLRNMKMEGEEIGKSELDEDGAFA
ncbi:hypothetical protein HDU67_001548 [Dinochytrium kinnereticum]|nr:hypothetical protein HDU67_001548 [Dinochytrium kinnereticum]